MAKLFNWHWLSWVIKGGLGIAVLLLSAILSYAFFQSIEPAGMAVFPFAALTLTEGGFVGWILIFSTMRHHKITGLIALLMILFSFVTTITVTFAELIQLFQDHTLVSNATVQNGTLILLEIMLGLHVLAAASDFLIGKIEWLVKEVKPETVTPQGVTVIEAQPVPAQLLPSPVQPSVHPPVQPSTPVQSVTQASAIDYDALAQAVIRQTGALPDVQSSPTSSPLQSPQLDTSASQPGTNGTNGHQK